MTSVWSWLADAFLALLLTVTLVMAFRLDRALRVIRRDRAVFETLISNLGAATTAVKSGIQTLRSEAERVAEQIERRTMEADKMATDLSFLAESADRAGARLEQTLRSALAVAQMDDPAAAPAPAMNAEHADPHRRRGMTGIQPAPAAPPAADKTVPCTGSSDEARPAPSAAWPGSDDQVAAAAAEIGSGASLGDLREMAGITTRRPRRLDNVRAHAGTDIGPASITQAG